MGGAATKWILRVSSGSQGAVEHCERLTVNVNVFAGFADLSVARSVASPAPGAPTGAGGVGLRFASWVEKAVCGQLPSLSSPTE